MEQDTDLKKTPPQSPKSIVQTHRDRSIHIGNGVYLAAFEIIGQSLGTDVYSKSAATAPKF